MRSLGCRRRRLGVRATFPEVQLVLATLALSAEFVASIDNGLGYAPPMGWRSWNCFGTQISQSRMEEVIDAIVAPRENGRSLADLGFRDVGLDDGWQACYTGIHGGFHDEVGRPLINLSTFPDVQNMTRRAHEQKLTVGFNANNCLCGETMYIDKDEISQHYAGDVAAFRELGFDGVKFDHCGQFNNLSRWERLINQSGRPMMMENCHWVGLVPHWEANGDLWCPFNYFRVSSDIKPDFDVMISNLQAMPKWAEIGKPISRPGCWAYPDMLEVGNLATYEESRAHFAAWVITSAPLILSLDVTNGSLVEQVWPILSNEEMIAINQLWAGHPGTVVYTGSMNLEDMAPYYVWALPCNKEDPDQQGWEFRRIGDSASRTVMIMSGNGLCVDVSVPAVVSLNTCNASNPFQQLLLNDSGAVNFMTAEGAVQCLEVTGKTGPTVQRTRCFPGSPKHQRFKLEGGVLVDWGTDDDDVFPPRCLAIQKKYPQDLPAHFVAWQIWAKPQPGGSLAVFVLNHAQERLQPKIQLSMLKDKFGSLFALPPVSRAGVKVRDVFERKDVGIFMGSVDTGIVPVRDGRLYLFVPVIVEPGNVYFFAEMLGVCCILMCTFGVFFTKRCQEAQERDFVGERGDTAVPASALELESADELSGSCEEEEDEEMLPWISVGLRGGDKIAQVVIFTLLWWGAAIYVTVMIKLAAGSAGSPSLPPFMLTCLFNTMTGALAWALSHLLQRDNLDLPDPSPYEVLEVVWLGIIQGCEIGFLNKSLQYLSISERTMMQNSNVLFMMLTAQLLNLERLTLLRVVAGLFLAGGGVMQGLGLSQQEVGQREPTKSEQLAHLTGIVFMLSSMLLTSFKWSMIQFMTQRSKSTSYLGQISKMQLTARVQPITGVVCLLLALLFERPAVLQAEVWNAGQLVRVPLIALGITVLMNSELKVVHLTSAVATGVLINLHHIPMVLASIAFFNDHVHLYSLCGFALCLVGSMCYAAARYFDSTGAGE